MNTDMNVCAGQVAATSGRRVSSRIAEKGRKDGVSVEQTQAEKQIPAERSTGSQAATQSNILMRGIRAIPSALGYLTVSTGRAVNEVFLEGLVSYVVFSRAAGIASSISRATGADFNGMMGVITVPVRKLATKVASGLWNLMPSLSMIRPAPTTPTRNADVNADINDAETQDTETQNAKDQSTESETKKAASSKKRKARGGKQQDKDVPPAVDEGSSRKKRPPRVQYS